MTRLSLAVVVTVLLGVSAHTQIATTTSLVGTVLDSTAKVVPGAAVTAVNTGTRDTYNTTTNEQGYYSIQFVRIGTYELRSSGFLVGSPCCPVGFAAPRSAPGDREVHRMTPSQAEPLGRAR